MLAIADADGIVSASIPGLASVSNVEQEAARGAIKILLDPDPDSRTKDFEGRRIEEINGGWRILNYKKYRRMLNQEERKEYKAKWIANKRLQESTNVDSRQSRRKSTQAEAEAREKEKEKETVVSSFSSSFSKKSKPPVDQIPVYDKPGPTHDPSDEERARVNAINKEEIENLRAKLRSA